MNRREFFGLMGAALALPFIGQRPELKSYRTPFIPFEEINTFGCIPPGTILIADGRLWLQDESRATPLHFSKDSFDSRFGVIE